MTSYSFDAPETSLRRRATLGVVKTGISQGVRLVIQLGSVIVLSRLLAPADFGLIAMVGPLLAFATLVQDLGLTAAIVRKPRLTQDEVSGLFFVSLGTSAALAALLAAGSPVAGWFYEEPRVVALTAALGLNIVASGAGSLHYALLNRRMQFGAIAIVDTLGAVASLVTSTTLGVLFHSVWALYAGTLVSAVVPTAGYWIATGWRPSLPRRGAGVRSALRFGANVTGFNIANFFSRNLDNVLIGRAWGERPLGLYDRAYKLMLMPLQQINNPMAKVMLPVLSQMVDDPDRYRQAFLRTLAQMLLVTLPGMAFMIGTSDVLIPFLLGPQWGEASPIFVALGMASLLQAMTTPTGWLFMSQDRSREYFYWGLFASVTTAFSFMLGLPYGPIGVAAAYAAGEYVRMPVLWWYATRRGPVRVRDVVRLGVPHYVAVAGSLGAIAAVRTVLPLEVGVVLAVGLVVSFAASGLVLLGFGHGRATIRQSLVMLQRAWPSSRSGRDARL